MKKKIAVVLGSKNDLDKLEPGFSLMQEFKIPYSVDVISAHRHPDKLRSYCKQMEKEEVNVVIACAGMAAALPGFIASYVDIPVIGVALKGGVFDGLDAVFSMISIPKGMGVACSGVDKNGFINAIIFALQILALNDSQYSKLLLTVKKKFR